MNDHLQFDEDLDLYALGALDPEERVAFESHLKECGRCKQNLAAAEERVGLLGLAVPMLEPPARVRTALLERARQGPRAAPIAATSKRSRFTLWHEPVVAWAFAVVVAAIALTLGTRNYRLQHRLDAMEQEMRAHQTAVAHDRSVAELLISPETQRVVLKQATEPLHPEGRVYYHPNRGLLFYASNLPAAPTDHTYQLWLVPAEGAPISAGVFQPNAKGDASVILPKLPSGVAAKAFAVTVEPSGGVPEPSGPKVLIGIV